jgi:predicted transcriptional regulator
MSASTTLAVRAGDVDRELAIIAGIKRGIDDMQAGRVIPHKQAMRRLRATAAGAAKARV